MRRTHLALLLLTSISCSSLALASSASASSQRDTQHASPQASAWPADDALSYCDTLPDLYTAISDDLSLWKADGIDRATMAASIDTFTTRGRNKGLALAFVNGTAYVVEAALDRSLGHHANIFFTYMQVILELQQLFGHLIPDVEFVIASSDRPMVLLNSSAPYPPVFRFCSSPVHADIQIPIFHFYTKRYTQAMLQDTAAVNQQYPWSDKQEILFGRFSNYLRYIIPGEPLLERLGTGGRTICKTDNADTAACRVRHHLIIWALRHPQLMDIKSSPRVPMLKHAQYKYLLHLDGQALSSRLDLLLPLNSLIFKESSGYTSFYHHLLKPKEHYIPVWVKTPDDILTALEWAKQHDEEAKRIASNAQQFAIKYLNKRARTCYWFRLLVEFSKLLKYQVSPEHEVQETEQKSKEKSKRQLRLGGECEVVVEGEEGGGAGASRVRLKPGERGCWIKVEDYLQSVAPRFEGGRYFTLNTEQF